MPQEKPQRGCTRSEAGLAFLAFGLMASMVLLGRGQAQPVLPLAPLLEGLPALVKHQADAAGAVARVQQDANYQQVLREKLAGGWFAALLSLQETELYSIQGRFETWNGLVEFLQEKNALVEAWAYGEGAHTPARRIPALELAELRQQPREQPSFITVTWFEASLKRVRACRVEFGFQAAGVMLEVHRAYERHRELQLAAHDILSARNARGQLDALAQWDALRQAVKEGRLTLEEMPPQPTGPNDLFAAVEFEVDVRNNFRKVARLYRESEVHKRIVGDAQLLVLKRAGEKGERQARGFHTVGVSDKLEPLPNPILGQDVVELRVVDAQQPEVRRWNVLEFGEPGLIRQAALARFSLLNAHLERQRKKVAMKRANLALIVEPMIAAMNIGGGLSGLGFPAGDAGRLLYNLITWRLIAAVPNAKEMRELFAVMAARERNPQLKVRPERFLSPADIEQLRQAGAKLSDAQVQAYLERMNDDDVRAMLRLARMGMFDARITTFLNLLTSAFKVSGIAEDDGPIRDLFNNVKFAMNGDINLKTLLALAVGQRNTTLLSGASLESLSQGHGAGKAWLQYLEVSVDLRAVANTLVRLTKRTLGKKELEKPFPYAPRLSDLAAYEVRIFGFPLFMFYKRGLIKADLEAYEHDFAYGVLGTRLVERFHTREEMDAEIRAGRMAPLGYVRVPGKGGWRETDLAVFAHRIPSGKHQGKTSLILYGMKAYGEHSEFIDRELERFRQFEQGLREGAVIEQVVRAEPGAGLTPRELEPELHVGPAAAQERYYPLFASLAELRREAVWESWGLPLEAADRGEADGARARLAARNISVPAGNPLVGVDKFGSSFIYRRQVNGHPQEVKVISLPSLRDIGRELQKAEEGQLIEETRREAAAGQTAGVVLLNEVKRVQGRLEIGPLRRDASGRVFGAGVLSGAKAVADIFSLIDRLPVTDRARLRFNHFAATVVELASERAGPREKAFLTIEFPLGEVKREWINPLTGEPEVLVFSSGLWRQAITARRVVEIDYDEANVETRSRTWHNRGTLAAPAKGELLEETRTLEVWLRDLSQPGLDPYAPMIAKLRLNHVTGQITRETFGLFPLPVETADDLFVTQTRYNPYGLFESARVSDNGQTEADFQRPPLDRVLRPLAGRERFRLAGTIPGLPALRDLAAQRYRVTLERTDLVKGLTKTEVLDNAHFGRKITESLVDPFDGASSFAVQTTFEYRDDGYYGQVPLHTQTSGGNTGRVLAEATTAGYDPVNRRLTAVETDYTGKVRTNTWDYRWTQPVETETRQRRTQNQYNREETTMTGTTSARSTGEILRTCSGQFEAGSKTWRVSNTLWHRPGAPRRVETNTYSPFGKLIATRIGEVFEARPTYSGDGVETARRTFRRNPATSRFDVSHRLEDSYQWREGGCEARVVRYLEGQPYDEYRQVTDAEGRLIVDGLRQWPQLALRTVITYEGESDRALQSETFQNGALRATHLALREVPRPGGGWLLPVRTVPAWGLSTTNRYLLEDPLARPVATAFENGEQARVAEWFADTAVARATEVFDRHGQPKDRFTKRVDPATEKGLPYDVVTHHRISPWGESGFAEDKAVVRGTDVALFTETDAGRVYFDLSQPYEAPQYAQDPRTHFGMPALVAGTMQPNVTAVFRTGFRELRETSPGNPAAERVMALEGIDLLGLFYHRLVRRTVDRAGRVLEERIGKIENLGTRAYTDEALFAEAGRATVTKRFTYRYEPGWLVRQTNAARQEAALAFTPRPPEAAGAAWRVNEAGWREWPTEMHGRQAATESLLENAGVGPYFFRRASAPRWLRRNPHLPGLTNVWIAWTTTELRDDGRTLFEAESIFDAQGHPSTTIAHKRNSDARPAVKLAYHLPSPSAVTWRTHALAQGSLALESGGLQDYSGCDFLAFYREASASNQVSLEFKDAAGRKLIVAASDSTVPDAAIPFWPVASGQVLWLPNDVIPVRGAVLSAPAALLHEGKVFAVAVPDLAKAGLDTRRVAAVTLRLTDARDGEVRISPLFRLAHQGPVLTPDTPRRFRYAEAAHGNGLEMFTRMKSDRTPDEVRFGRGWESLVNYNGSVVASVAPRALAPYYPVAMLVDNSDPELPRPLYALAAEDGRFLEYYQTLHLGDAQVYTVVSGFETPKLEVFRAGILDDEISPGVLAFGYGYSVTLPLAKASGGWARTLARLRNRCVASAFTLGGDRFLQFAFNAAPSQTEFGRLTRELGPASRQAEEINRLPTLAGALLPLRPPPWTNLAGTRPLSPAAVSPRPDPSPRAREGGPGRRHGDEPDQPAPSPGTPANAATTSPRPSALRTRLNQLSTRYLRTKLIPTSLGTETERFVNTAQEGEIIQLAVGLNEVSLAGELISFYWEKSQGGLSRLHAFYDATTGASLTKEPRYERASDAETTAQAQLAIAEAAFCLGTATGDRNALELGRNLVTLLLRDFRLPASPAAWPRGIAERRAQEEASRYGLTFWPAAKSFSLQSNARAYLLFTRLEAGLDRYPFDPQWKKTLQEAAREQAAWLTNRILPQVQRTGVVPRGLFDVQDVHTRTSALAVDRWSAADDWLTFLEAAHRLGLDPGTNRFWLENLARVHGVTLGGVWGLDWSIALERPEAISTDLTAKFARVARLLGHDQAAEFAQRSLDQARRGDQWPAVVTRARPQGLLPTGQGFAIYPAATADARRAPTNGPPVWSETLGVQVQLAGLAWPTNLAAGKPVEAQRSPRGDITQFFWLAAGFYLAILVVTLCWWQLSAQRRRAQKQAQPKASSGCLVPAAVMEKAEERWAKRVLGVRGPPNADRSRYSNGAIEQNFHMQLRAIYKLVLEWRRLSNGWEEDDPRLVEDGSDDWLNGLDEFAVMVGLYSRWVVKAGRKDGGRKLDVLEENEDSNHVWSRLVMYFSESHLGLLNLIQEFKQNPAAAEFFGTNDGIGLVLRTLGLRQRPEPFDARAGFDAPASPAAMDLLVVQLPGATLTRIVEEMESKLGIPADHVTSFIKGFKSFKEREHLYPIHPYLLEAAKMLPHFLLMGLVSLIWYNRELGGLKIFPYIKELAADMALDARSLLWAVPLFGGFLLSVAAYVLDVYRYRWKVRAEAQAGSILDATVTSIFRKEGRSTTPTVRSGRWWDPLVYQRSGWLLRAIGLLWLGVSLLQREPPSFAAFMFLKGLVALVLFAEAAGIGLPLLLSALSIWLEDYVTGNPRTGRFVRFLNQLNVTPTRPASLVWLSFRYHFQPSVPTGGWWAMVRCIVFYLVFAAVFFAVGSYMFKQALEVWFQETYQSGWDLGLVLGGFLFWNTMYLLRFGLFVLFTGVGAAWVNWPLKVLGGVAALAYFGLELFQLGPGQFLRDHPVLTCGLLVAGLAAMAFEAPVLAWIRRLAGWGPRAGRRPQAQERALDELRQDPNRALGIVYMSGDDLSFHKLTSELLMSRLALLRDQLGSGGLRLLARLQGLPDDASLARQFQALYDLEKRSDATLWHPLQLVVSGEKPWLRAELGLNLPVESAEQRDQILSTWHLRRWLVTMMSTAGHSQDTAINLVDIALRLAQEGLSANTVFYLIQNKYDNNDNNRPSQLPYDKGELGQRNKLARLFMEVAPGCRAYNVNDWTPFGFKAGGLVGMDLVYEESLKLTNMLVLDRNANAHDIDSVIADLKLALSDPGVVIIIPGRSTTNTLTPLGQGSQLVEEGNRALTKGVMLLGGTGAETLGTGWGNIQAVYYGRVQRALCDPSQPKMPLTGPTRRGAPFGERYEGLIGFGPHAVGISEDIWGVTQAAHNALGLGYRVRFERSQTLWHKIRESWSHAEWFAAFPRWSGGYVQMMLDPMMQLINDQGPLSVFAKEIRANGGRFFLSAPAALLSILLMPLAIIADVSPFVQILILLWNLGFVMNQVLTALGLVSYLECTGFNRISALAGTALAGGLSATVKGLAPYAPALLVFGFLIGGFAMGLGRWLYYRGRDVMLFGPQLVIHVLGQVIRQSLEFVLSGAAANDAKAVNILFRAWAGPREDRPFETYPNLINLRTVVWGVGVLSLVLSLFALANLDFLNVLLLLPSLMFSVSTLLGPFVMHPKPGRHLGCAAWAPKLLGWVASFSFYAVIAWLVARGGGWAWLGLALFLGCLGRLLMIGLRYAGYPRQVRRLTQRLARHLARAGLEAAAAEKFAQNIIRGLGGDPEKTRAALGRTTLAAEEQAGIVKLVAEEVLPLLQRPVADLRRGRWAGSRSASEFNRSFVLGLFTFLWFFIVPIPGLLVFTAPGGYRISMPLSAVVALVGGAVAVTLAGLGLSLALEWLAKHGLGGNGLLARITREYQRFQSLARQPGRLTAAQTANLYALFTEVQTYVDQRSYEYARQTLAAIERLLGPQTQASG